MDASGNLYGISYGGGANQVGTVYNLTPSNGGWNYSTLHSFSGGADGCSLYGSVLLDAAETVYGTAAACPYLIPTAVRYSRSRHKAVVSSQWSVGLAEGEAP